MLLYMKWEILIITNVIYTFYNYRFIISIVIIALLLATVSQIAVVVFVTL